MVPAATSFQPSGPAQCLSTELHGALQEDRAQPVSKDNVSPQHLALGGDKPPRWVSRLIYASVTLETIHGAELHISHIPSCSRFPLYVSETKGKLMLPGPRVEFLKVQTLGEAGL